MGFFSTNKQKIDKGPSNELLHSLACKACPLDKITANQHPHMKPTGAAKPLLYILGEAPGKNEDLEGAQFVGESGRLLRSKIPKAILAQTRFNNVVRTRPIKNATPDRVPIECCRPSIELDIFNSKPKVIFGFGNIPLAWANPDGHGITTWRGRRFPVDIKGHECWFYPMLHPAYIIRKQYSYGGLEEERAFSFDIKNALAEIEFLPPAEVHNRQVAEYGIEIFDGKPGQIDKIKKSFEWALKQKEVGFDYETNGIRPYIKNAKILTAAIGTPEVSFAFALNHKQSRWSLGELDEVKALLIEFLKSPVRKIVHHLPFEQEWTGIKFGSDILSNTAWDDTLTQASVLDERHGASKRKGGPLSLDFLCRQYFGFNLKALSNLDISKLDDEPLDKVLRYNAMDAKYHYLLFKAQQERINNQGLENVYKRDLKRIPSCVLTQIRGVNIDQKVTKTLDKEYKAVISESLASIEALKVVTKFEKLQDKTFNPESDSDVLFLLRDILKRKEIAIRDKYDSEKIRYTTEAEVLEKIDHPICPLILKLRKARKKQSTYLYQNTEDKIILWPDNLLHAIFNHGPRTNTYRLSCEDPNLQNMPKRNDEGKKIRAQIIPRAPDRSLASIDYGQIEYRVFAMASKDQSCIKNLWDRYDVHGDWAARLARAYPARIGGKQYLNDKAVMKAFRNDPIKSGWTFGLFFGARLETAAEYCKIPIEKLKPEFREFRRMFKGIFDWHETIIDFYKEHNYVENLLGRRRRGPLSKNQAINDPIQSTAAEIVMNGMNRLSRYALETGDMNFQPIVNIHDDLTFDLPDDKIDYYLEKIITEMLSVNFKFINVPITLEVSIGKSLLDMEEVMTVSSDSWGK